MSLPKSIIQTRKRLAKRVADGKDSGLLFIEGGSQYIYNGYSAIKSNVFDDSVEECRGCEGNAERLISLFEDTSSLFVVEDDFLVPSIIRKALRDAKGEIGERKAIVQIEKSYYNATQLATILDAFATPKVYLEDDTHSAKLVITSGDEVGLLVPVNIYTVNDERAFVILNIDGSDRTEALKQMRQDKIQRARERHALPNTLRVARRQLARWSKRNDKYLRVFPHNSMQYAIDGAYGMRYNVATDDLPEQNSAPLPSLTEIFEWSEKVSKVKDIQLTSTVIKKLIREKKSKLIDAKFCIKVGEQYYDAELLYRTLDTLRKYKIYEGKINNKQGFINIGLLLDSPDGQGIVMPLRFNSKASNVLMEINL